MPQTTDKTDRAKSSLDIKSLGEITVMKIHKRGLRYTFPIFSAVAGTLMLMSAFAPRAEAAIAGLQYYFDFNLEPNNTNAPFTSRATGSFGGTYPANGADATQTSLITGEAGLNGFATGNLVVVQPPPANGTTVNAVTGDIAGGGLQIKSNSTTATDKFCFTIGAMNLTGLQDASLTFALKGGGTGGFTTLELAYSFTNTVGSFTTFDTIAITGTTYAMQTANLPPVTDGASSLYVSFCFTGSSNAGTGHATFIDNIQVTAAVPEPTTAATGVLAVLAVFGLCWSQRRCLIQSLRLRRT